MRFFSFISKGEIHNTGEAIIPAEDFSLLLTASQILAKAKEDAETFKKNLSEEASLLKERAKEEGFEEGLSQFNDKLLALDEQLKLLKIELQNQILPIAIKAAHKIVSTELKMRPEVIVDIVIKALNPVLQSKQVTIVVNKLDKEALESAKPHLKTLLEKVDSFTIIDRPDVSQGGCLIETEAGIINATIENQWRVLELALSRYAKPS